MRPAFAIALEILQGFVFKACRSNRQHEKQKSDHLMPQNSRRPDGHWERMLGEVHGSADQMLATRPEKKPEVHASMVSTPNFSFVAPTLSPKTADKNSVGQDWLGYPLWRSSIRGIDFIDIVALVKGG